VTQLLRGCVPFGASIADHRCPLVGGSILHIRTHGVLKPALGPHEFRLEASNFV
jgi:hypothetical protein